MDDPFIRDYIEELLKNIRTQVLIKLIKPYTRIEVGFISKELNITPAEVESLLVSLILDNKVNGRIDQVNQRLELIAEYLPSFFFLSFSFFFSSFVPFLLHRGSDESRKYTAISKWSTQLGNLNRTVNNRLS